MKQFLWTVDVLLQEHRRKKHGDGKPLRKQRVRSSTKSPQVDSSPQSVGDRSPQVDSSPQTTEQSDDTIKEESIPVTSDTKSMTFSLVKVKTEPSDLYSDGSLSQGETDWMSSNSEVKVEGFDTDAGSVLLNSSMDSLTTECRIKEEDVNNSHQI